MTPAPRDKLLPAAADALKGLSGAMALVAGAAPERMTMRQLYAFIIVARADAMGTKLTLADVRRWSRGVLGQSIERSIETLLPPTDDMPNAMGWLYQLPSERDHRCKYLALTEKGRRAVGDLAAAMARAG